MIVIKGQLLQGNGRPMTEYEVRCSLSSTSFNAFKTTVVPTEFVAWPDADGYLEIELPDDDDLSHTGPNPWLWIIQLSYEKKKNIRTTAVEPTPDTVYWIDEIFFQGVES